jgi:hypothetical protein
MKGYEELQVKLQPIFEIFDNEQVLAKIQERAHQHDVLNEELKPFGVCWALLSARTHTTHTHHTHHAHHHH